MTAPNKIRLIGVWLAMIASVPASLLCSAETKQPILMDCQTKLVVPKWKSATETLAHAKQLMGLASDAPPGLLWRTYMTRLYRVPDNATIEQMKASQVKRDWRFSLLAEGLPEWAPIELINLKENFELNVMAKIAVRRMLKLSWFASDEEVEKIAAQKRKEYQSQARSAKRKFDDEHWIAECIIRGYELPEDTSEEEAHAAQNRAVHIFGGAFTEKAMTDLKDKIQREDDLLILRPTTHTPDEVLRRNRMAILEAIALESPDKPTKFVFWY